MKLLRCMLLQNLYLHPMDTSQVLYSQSTNSLAGTTLGQPLPRTNQATDLSLTRTRPSDDLDLPGKPQTFYPLHSDVISRAL